MKAQKIQSESINQLINQSYTLNFAMVNRMRLQSLDCLSIYPKLNPFEIQGSFSQITKKKQKINQNVSLFKNYNKTRVLFSSFSHFMLVSGAKFSQHITHCNLIQ